MITLLLLLYCLLYDIIFFCGTYGDMIIFCTRLVVFFVFFPLLGQEQRHDFRKLRQGNGCVRLCLQLFQQSVHLLAETEEEDKRCIYCSLGSYRIYYHTVAT